MPHLFHYEVECIACSSHNIRENTLQNVQYTDSSIFLVLCYLSSLLPQNKQTFVSASFILQPPFVLLLLQHISLSSQVLFYTSAVFFLVPFPVTTYVFPSSKSYFSDLSHIITRLHFKIAFFIHQDLTHGSVPFRKHWTKGYLEVFLKNTLEWKSGLQNTFLHSGSLRRFTCF